MVPRSGRTLQLSSKKQPLGLHLRWRSTTGALHTPEGQLADAPSRTLWRQPRPWTSWRTTLPLSSLQLPLDDCSSAAADAVEASANRTHPQHFDLVVSGGGLAAFYGGAVSSVLATLQQRGLLQVGSLHGVSSGALVCATFLGCEAGFTKLSDMYRCHEIFVQARPWLSYGMREFLDECLPPDIHERASGRMHVTVSEVLAPKEPGGLVHRNLWPRKRVISEFRTRVEFLDTVMASTMCAPASPPDLARVHPPRPSPCVCAASQGSPRRTRTPRAAVASSSTASRCSRRRPRPHVRSCASSRWAQRAVCATPSAGCCARVTPTST